MTISNNLEPFLHETEYCDFNHKEIKGLAYNLTKDAKNDREKAVVLFYWVRDNILYRVGYWNKKASETLRERKGVCTSKNNLLISMLRAIRIPAGYGIMRVDGRKYFGIIVPDFLKNKISKNSIHVYSFVYLDNKWLKCDPSDDAMFSENTAHLNPQSKLVDWDGKNHATLNLHPDHILKDIGPINNIDAIIEKKPKTATKNIVEMGNLYIEFLRENGKRIDSISEIPKAFRSWIKKRHTYFYFIFQLVSFWQNIKSKLGIIKY
jgi:hypothetical protein